MAIFINDIDKSPSGVRAPDNPPYRPPQRLGGFLAPGIVIAANDTNGVLVNVLASGRIRVCALVSAGGTLRLRWRLADHVTSQPIVASNPADPGTALVGGTQLVVDVANNPGHGYLEVAVVNGGAPSTVSYVDVFVQPVAS